MKRFLLAIVLCASLLGVLSTVLFPPAVAAENPLLALLNLPAPPPPNPRISYAALSPPTSYTKENPPPDEEPIESLLEFWKTQSQSYNELRYNPKPSEKVLARLIREIEKDPAKLGDLINVLPRNASTAKLVKEIYDKSASGSEAERAQRTKLKRWLKFNSQHFSSELAQEASRVADADDYVINHDSLIALARVDWERAGPIVNRLYNDLGQKASRSAALWALYVHAMESDSPGDTERYREELKEIVADKTLTPGVRDLALDALSLEKEWPGRDDWYLSVMEDETLTDLGRFTGLTTLIATSPEGKYVDRMIGLLASDNIAVRSAAAQNLLDRIEGHRAEVVKALVPWLENPKWLRQTGRSGRQTLIQSLAQVKAPESVPGLIAALDEKDQRPAYPAILGNMNVSADEMNAVLESMPGMANSVARAANTPYSSANANAGPSGPYYNLRHSAIDALAFQKDPRAVPALKRILNEGGHAYGVNQIIRAIYECGGFSIVEQVAAVESVATAVEAEANFKNLTANAANAAANFLISDPGASNAYAELVSAVGNASTAEQSLGLILVGTEEVSDDLVRAVIERVGSLERSDPALAKALRRVLLGWKGAAVNAMLLRDLKNNRIDTDAVVRLLSLRKELRETQSQDLSDLRTGGPAAVGISSCLLEDTNDHEAILDTANDETKTALLACARLIRAPLTVGKVATNLQSTDKLLALAAERYLESEDSPEARRIVLSRHPGEAMLLGATSAFYPTAGEQERGGSHLEALFATVSAYHAQPDYDFAGEGRDGELAVTETRLQEELKADPELLGVYSWDKSAVRIFKDRAVLTWHEDPARYRERTLTNEEFDNIKDFLAHHKVDELPPFLTCLPSDNCEERELLMLGRNGGRRVFVVARPRLFPAPFDDLDRMFEDLRRPPSTVKYWAAKNVPGLELLFHDDRLDAKAVWKNGSDFRLLTADKIRRTEIDSEVETFGENLSSEDEETDSEFYGEDPRLVKERARREYENYSWNMFADGALAGAASQPSQAEFIPSRDALGVPAGEARWKARTGSVEIRADEKGLYKVVAGKLSKIATGMYQEPVISPSGRWVVVTRFDGGVASQLVRVNLLTNKQYPVQSDETYLVRAVAFLPTMNRFLVGPPIGGNVYMDHEEDRPDGEDGEGFYLLNPENGSLIPARGDIRPLVQQTYRPLQPTSNPYEFWAAIPKDNETVVARYDSRVFTIKPILRLPKISFNSMDMWADEGAGKFYFVYEGHLLAVPIKPGSAGLVSK